MRILLQRVSKASVFIFSINYFQSIEQGIVVFVGISPNDNQIILEKLCNKLINLRIFEDQNKKMTYSLLDIKGEILVIPQFTLYADLSKGNRPDFQKAAKPEYGKYLFDKVVWFLEQKAGKEKVKTGIFGTDMLVEIFNEGPVTILLEKEN